MLPSTAADLTTAAESSPGFPFFQTDLDQLSSSVFRLVEEGLLDEADAVCKQLRCRYPEVQNWLMRMTKVWDARDESERAIACMDAHQADFDPESRELLRQDIERLRASLDAAS